MNTYSSRKTNRKKHGVVISLLWMDGTCNTIMNVAMDKKERFSF